MVFFFLKKKENTIAVILTRHQAPETQGSIEFSFPHLKKKTIQANNVSKF